MTRSTRRLAQGTPPTRAELQSQVDRLETSLRRSLEHQRSLRLMLERAEEASSQALKRLSICAEENAIRRQLLAQARADLARLAATAIIETP